MQLLFPSYAYALRGLGIGSWLVIFEPVVEPVVEPVIYFSQNFLKKYLSDAHRSVLRDFFFEIVILYYQKNKNAKSDFFE